MKDKKNLIKDIIGLHEKSTRMVSAYHAENWMKLNLTIDQLKSLILIYSLGKISYKELAKALGISRSNITGLADRLIKNDLITRNQDPKDRRIQYLRLTDKALGIINDIKQKMDKDATRVLTNLSIDELTALKMGLCALIKAAETDMVYQQTNGERV